MREQEQIKNIPKMTSLDNKRRTFLKTATSAGAALAVSSAFGPFIHTAAAKTITWNVQSSWNAGTSGYTLFEEWCQGFKEKSDGALEIKPFPAQSVASHDDALFKAVQKGILHGMNPFTVYWAEKIPSSVFLSSYPAGPDQPAQWDVMFDGLGMTQIARDIYAKHGLFYVGHIHHDANIIHSKKPVASLADFKGLKLRVPGGMVAEVFQAFGANTISLPSSDIFPALEKGTIDAADYVGPAVNWDLGFAQVTKYILFGPPSLMSVYQPVDLMDLTINLEAWNRLDNKLQALVEQETRSYSYKHYIGIQKRNVEALKKFEEAGSTVTRMSQEDLHQFRKKAIPIWFNWAKKSPDATQVFKLQLDYMLNDIMGYITNDDIKGFSL